MPKKRTKRRAKRQRHHTPLAQHKRQRKKLVTPFNAIPNLRAVEWVADVLPEHLFSASILNDYDHPDPAWLILEALDPFVAEGEFLDGHVSSFALVPEERRREALEALAQPHVPPLPDPLRAALGLYPDGPAAWLAGALGGAGVDREAALACFASVVAEIFDSRGVAATRARLVVVGRWVRAKRLHVPSSFLDESLIPRYPGSLTEGEQRMAESEIRAMYGAMQGAAQADEPAEGDAEESAVT